MRRRHPGWAALLFLCGLLAACGGAPTGPNSAAEAASPPAEQDLLAGAAAEATAIVQRAQATALVLQARAQATALLEQAVAATATPPPPATNPAAVAPSPAPSAPLTNTVSAPTVEPSSAVEVLDVGFAAEGGMIMVQFLAPPEVAEKWWPGTVSLTDEGNGAVYNEIPVLPKIGPLIGRPKVDGQLGYVMLVNAPPYLQPGALATVVLGTHTFEHVPVQ